MSTRSSLYTSLERANADHEILDLYIRCYNRILSRASPSALRDATEGMRLFLRKKVVEHFAFEERTLFPALLDAFPDEAVADLVSDLRDDHKRLLRQAERLDKTLTDETAAYNRASLLRKGMQQFFHSLEKHAIKESELIPSLL